MSDHDPKCLAYGYGPGQRMDICICTGIRIGRADEREQIAQAIEAKKFLSWSANARLARDGGRDE